MLVPMDWKAFPSQRRRARGKKKARTAGERAGGVPLRSYEAASASPRAWCLSASVSKRGNVTHLFGLGWEVLEREVHLPVLGAFLQLIRNLNHGCCSVCVPSSVLSASSCRLRAYVPSPFALGPLAVSLSRLARALPPFGLSSVVTWPPLFPYSSASFTRTRG